MFLVKIGTTGALTWSTCFSWYNNAWANCIAVDGSGNAWVSGNTDSPGWASGGFDTTYNGGTQDAFVAKISEPPSVDTPQFLYSAAQQFKFQFNRPISASSNFAALEVLNLTTGQTISSSLFTAQRAANNTTVTWTYSVGILPDGNYRATLPAGSISDLTGQPMAADYSFDFFVLAGDANRDRTVNFSDLLVVSQNYGQTGKTWSQGDFNYDGTVTMADLLIVAQQYNKTLPAPAPALASVLPTSILSQTPASALVHPVKRTPFKVIGLIE